LCLAPEIRIRHFLGRVWEEATAGLIGSSLGIDENPIRNVVSSEPFSIAISWLSETLCSLLLENFHESG
jgi:hypothetical protein